LLVHVASTLARTGMVHLGTPIHVADATRITLAELVDFRDEVERYTRQDAMILLALPALTENVTSLSLAQFTDLAMLLVLLNHMSIVDGKKTVERIGAGRFLGSAILRLPEPGTSKRA
jgi:hypothetical protein